MDTSKLYSDISKRTLGDIYIGVVGPVRTGKSTFIKRFMDTMVIPNIDNIYKKERAKDELPQSGTGRTIMTTEPKFVPEEAIEISLEEGVNCKLRLVDCVGYLVEGAMGHMEEDLPRMVSTPWDDMPMEMVKAAEMGTKKVITEHSTIGLVVTTDGSIGEIEKSAYEPAQDKVIEELKEINKPFLVIVNSKNPRGQEAKDLCNKIIAKHNVSCIAVDCLRMDSDDILKIIGSVLYEFPVSEIEILLPKWVNALSYDNKIRSSIYSGVADAGRKIEKMADIKTSLQIISQIEDIHDCGISKMNLATGNAQIDIDIPSSKFYEVLSQQTGFDIADEAGLIPVLEDLSRIRKEYEKIDSALNQVRQTGYGIVMPSIEELSLEEPKIVKQGGRFGVKLKASAPSIHMIRADIETEVSPVVGSEKQSEELVSYLLSEFEEQPDKIWESNIFGKSLHELVSEGLNNKLNRMPEQSRYKLQETLQRIINEGDGIIITLIF